MAGDTESVSAGVRVEWADAGNGLGDGTGRIRVGGNTVLLGEEATSQDESARHTITARVAHQTLLGDSCVMFNLPVSCVRLDFSKAANGRHQPREERSAARRLQSPMPLKAFPHQKNRHAKAFIVNLPDGISGWRGWATLEFLTDAR